MSFLHRLADLNPALVLGVIAFAFGVVYMLRRHLAVSLTLVLVAFLATLLFTPNGKHALTLAAGQRTLPARAQCLAELVGSGVPLQAGTPGRDCKSAARLGTPTAAGVALIARNRALLTAHFGNVH